MQDVTQLLGEQRGKRVDRLTCSHSAGKGHTPMHMESRAAPVEQPDTMKSTGRTGVFQNGRDFMLESRTPV